MFYLSRRLCCGNKTNRFSDIARVATGSATPTDKYLHFSLRREGNWPPFSFYQVGAISDWIHSLPPRRCACVHLGAKGPWLATAFASRLWFPFKTSAPSRGRTAQRFLPLVIPLRWKTTISQLHMPPMWAVASSFTPDFLKTISRIVAPRPHAVLSTFSPKCSMTTPHPVQQTRMQQVVRHVLVILPYNETD
jgi:hypothetical protein